MVPHDVTGGFNLARHLRFGVWDELIVFGAVGLILVIGSTLWLQRFSRGPVEWLWHWMYVRLSRLTARKGGRGTPAAAA